MSQLVPCPACRRHTLPDLPCPFCGAPDTGPAPPSRDADGYAMVYGGPPPRAEELVTLPAAPAYGVPPPRPIETVEAPAATVYGGPPLPAPRRARWALLLALILGGAAAVWMMMR